MLNPVVEQILGWSRIYRQCADAALDATARRLADDPTSAAKQLDYRQAVQHHSTVLAKCSEMLDAGMAIVAGDATRTLGAITDGTNRLAAVLQSIATVQKVADVLADLATTVTDVAAAVTTLSPTKVLDAASDLKTLVADTVGGGSDG